VIEEAAERAVALTRQLLAFSRREVLKLQVLEVNQIVLEIEKMLGRVVGEQIVLRTQIDRGLWRVKADPAMLEQALVNLVVNARDAITGSGTVTIETKNVVLGAAGQEPGLSPGPYVQISVIDTGCGMTPEVRARIFEPFFTTKEKGKGTGLGLATVYGGVRQAQGDIIVDSQVGVGSSFRIFLPATTEEMPLQGTVPKSPPPRGGKETILVAEDETPVRHLVRRMLQRDGYQVIDAPSAEDALALVARHPGTIDLLLTDIVMPEMSGLQLAARLSAQHPSVRVVLMSGYLDNPQEQREILKKGLPFLPKPFTQQELLALVRATLDSAQR
jgi:CheY-like chemotaxis protein